MRYKRCFIIAVIVTVLFAGNFLRAQGFIEMYNMGVNIIDPILPDTLVRQGLKIDDVHERAKQGAESVGWTQNQSSPNYIAIIITAKSLDARTQIYTIEAEWGTDQSSLGGNPNSMGTDETLSRTVVLSSREHSLILAAVNELSRQAAQKVRAKMLRELQPHYFNMRSEL
jgi:hypothetical protein